jgi:hypothetical protein
VRVVLVAYRFVAESSNWQDARFWSGKLGFESLFRSFVPVLWDR